MSRLFLIAWQGVRARPITSVLAVIGLSVGVVTLVTVTAASSAVASAIKQSALLQGGPPATFRVSGAQGEAGLRLSQADAGLISHGNRGTSATTVDLANVSVVHGSDTLSISPLFCDPSIWTIFRYPVVAGSWLASDVDGVPRVVTNESASSKSGLTPGTRVTISVGDSEPLVAVVGGVVDDGQDNADLYVSLPSTRQWLSTHSGDMTSGFVFSSPSMTEGQLHSSLLEVDALAGHPQSWDIQRSDSLSTVGGPLATAASSFIVVGIFGALGAALAMANLGLGTVRERSIELSVRRALGAHRSQVATILLLEYSILGAVGGLVSIPLSLGLYGLIEHAFDAPAGVTVPGFPLQYAFVGLAVGIATSIVGGLWPVVRASTLPIAAFTRE